MPYHAVVAVLVTCVATKCLVLSNSQNRTGGPDPETQNLFRTDATIKGT